MLLCDSYHYRFSAVALFNFDQILTKVKFELRTSISNKKWINYRAKIFFNVFKSRMSHNRKAGYGLNLAILIETSNDCKVKKIISNEKWLLCGARLRRPTAIKDSVTISRIPASTITAQTSQVNKKLWFYYAL